MQRLPDDIPCREALINAGFINYAVLRNHKSIATIRGVGQKGAKKIHKYLEGGNKNHSSDYTISQLRDMDLSDKDESFFEGDDRRSIDQFK